MWYLVEQALVWCQAKQILLCLAHLSYHLYFILRDQIEAYNVATWQECWR